MPRYFFHVNDGLQYVDREGVELHGPAKAHIEAVIAAGNMLRDVDGHFENGNWSLRVIDDNGDMVSDIKIIVQRRRRA